MTIRRKVSLLYNRWNDAQRVDKPDMDTEQDRNIDTDAAIVQNHFGSGIVLSAPTPRVLFDSDALTLEQAALVASNDFDGTGVAVHQQPSDSSEGVQLEVNLSGSAVFGRFSTKVAIFGVDFEGSPQVDRFEFYKNESQVTKKHYARILGIFFVDFKGNSNCSRNHGGRIVIKEATSFQLSRDEIMVAQDIEPNLFFRDFKVSNFISSSNPTISLFNTLQGGIGSEFSIDSFDINTTVKRDLFLNANDVSTKFAQKFKATTNNIQKVSILLGTGRDDSVGIENRYDWSGKLVISIHALQTSVSCPTDIVPELAIEFDPEPEPIAQISVSQAELRDNGYVLTDVLQPIDFFFGDTVLGSTTNPVIQPNRFYVIVVNRSGNTSTGNIFTGIGNNKLQESRFTVFNSSWVDVPEEDLWFRVYHAAAKVADGQGYDNGNGIQIEKTKLNDLGAIVDNVLDAQTFANTGQNVLNTAIVQASEIQSQREQDERTGNSVFSRQRFEPTFSFVTSSGLADLKATAEPLIIGCAQDMNPKSNTLLDKIQDLPGLVNGDVFTIVQPDPDLLSLNLLGSKLIPNNDCAAKDYRIFKVELCVDGYGDVNGDGYVDADDVARAAALVGESITSASTQQKIVDGSITTLELLRADVNGDGYISSTDVDLINQYVLKEINSFPVGSTFNHLNIQVQPAVGRFDGYFDCGDGYVRLDGYTGINIIDGDILSQSEKEYFGLKEVPDMDGADSAFNTVPFVPIAYQVKPQPFWQPYLLTFNSEARLVPVTFTFNERTTVPNCQDGTEFECEDRSETSQSCDPGRNDFFIPDNLIMRRGQILNPDGTHYAVDFEVANIILQLPATSISEGKLNVFEKLVADTGNGQTSAGFSALRFSDCTTVQQDALARNQVRFGVAIQSINRNFEDFVDSLSLDGYSSVSGPYDPTITNQSGATFSTLGGFYTRVGNTVFCSVKFSLTGISSSLRTANLDLPINPSVNFTSATNAIGNITYFDSDKPIGVVVATVSTNTVNMLITGDNDSGISEAHVTFQYQIEADVEQSNISTVSADALEDKLGIHIDNETGILSLNTDNNVKDSILLSLITKIQITVYLKKAGWKNEVRVIEADQIQGLLS